MIDHSHFTHGCRPGRYREHDPRDRIYDAIRDLAREQSSSSVKRIIFVVYRKKYFILIAFQMRHSSDAINNIFKEFQEKNSFKTQEKNYSYVNPVFFFFMT